MAGTRITQLQPWGPGRRYGAFSPKRTKQRVTQLQPWGPGKRYGSFAGKQSSFVPVGFVHLTAEGLSVPSVAGEALRVPGVSGEAVEVA